ncbi:MAG: oleate hydratase [Cyanobacteriota bacterium]|nr:oleate hydratase [Cyanobacteriota bacterium]
MTTPAMPQANGESQPAAIVVGAGIAGLSAAFYLAERGFAVTVFEKEKTAGGNLGATHAHPKQARSEDLGDVFEVYPHMFGDWYNNFWQVMEAIGRGKANTDVWRAMTEFKFLSKPPAGVTSDRPSYRTLRNNGALLSQWSNLVSGIIPLPDMFLASYAALGLLAEDFKDINDLNVATLNDFLNTRFYGTKYVAQFYQMIILYIWSLEPDESSVYACQRFFQYQFRRPSPTAWVLNSGDAYSSIVQPLVHHLKSKWQVKFRFDTPVVAASLNQEKNSVEQLLIIENYSDHPCQKLFPKHPEQEAMRSYVFAVPPETLAALVQTPIPLDLNLVDSRADAPVSIGKNNFGIITDILIDPPPPRDAQSAAVDKSHPSEMMSVDVDEATMLDTALPADQRSTPAIDYSLPLPTPVRAAIVDAIPDLATAKTLSAEPIPVLYIGFKAGAAINHLIPEHYYVGLTESKYALTFVEVTHEFKLANPQIAASAHAVETIIALAASDYGELPIFRTPPAQVDRQGGRLPRASEEVQSLEDKSRNLLLSEAMHYLPFNDADIEWCFFRTNTNHRLFLNDVESARNPVQTVYRSHASARPIINNLAFAGDFCSQDVVMSTVEAAVESGIRAGMQLVDNTSQGQHPTAVRPKQTNKKSAFAGSSEVGVERLTLQTHSTYPRMLLTSCKLMLMPYAVLAKSWSDCNQCVEQVFPAKTPPLRLQQDVLSPLLTYWPRQASMCLGAYQDALNTMTSLATETMLNSSALLMSTFTRR